MNELHSIVKLSIVPLNMMAIVCFFFILYKFQKAKAQPFNFYTRMTVYRCYCHVFSSILTLSVFLVGEKALAMMMLTHLLLDCFPIYFLLVELVMAVNRCVAVKHYANYDRIFTDSLCKLLTLAALCTAVAFTSFMKLNTLFPIEERDKQMLTSIFVLCLCGLIINAITLKSIIRSSRKIGKFKKSFCLATSQLLLSCALFVHVLFLDEDQLEGPIELLILLAGNTTKDFVESIFTLYFFRHTVFGRTPLRTIAVSVTIR